MPYHSMSPEKVVSFLMDGTRTGHLATVRKDATPHVAPIWFVVDGEDIVFNTGESSVKGRNIRRDGYAAISIDDPHPPFSFVSISGPVEVVDDLVQVRHWATEIAARYMGSDKAEAYGARNGVPGELVCRLRMERVTAVENVAD